MFLRYHNIIDTVRMDCMLRISEINYAKQWMTNGKPDDNSIKMFLIDNESPVHAHLRLTDFCERTGFLLTEAWDYGGNVHLATPVVINLHNVNLVRPYTMRREITNWVIYFKGGHNSNLHVSVNQGKRIQELLSKP
jgi:hypothetical protein